MPPPEPPNNLRITLQTALDNLSDRSTFPQSASHLTRLAATLPSHHLPTFLNSVFSSSVHSSSSSARAHCISLLSLLAGAHSPDALAPHLGRILGWLLARLREPESSAVRAACGPAAAALSAHGFAVVVESLVAFVSSEHYGGAQIGGCVCLKAAVDSVDDKNVLLDGGDEAMLRKVLMRAMKLVKVEGFKAKAGMMGVMASVVGVNGGVIINGKYGGGGALVGNVVGVAVEMLSSEDWGARKGGAEVLQMVADVVDVGYVSHVKKFVVSSLDTRRFDKVKATREIMNRAWEAWKAIPGGLDEVLPLSRSSSSISKDSGDGGGGAPRLQRRSSFAGSEAAKPKKTMTKSRSSLSTGRTSSIPPSMSTITQDNIGREMPQRKQTLSKSRSSLSDDSTMPSLAEDSSVYKRTPSETYDRNSPDCKVEVAVSPASSVKFDSEDEIDSQDKTTEATASSSNRRSSFSKSSEQSMQETVEEDSDHGFDIEDRLREEAGLGTADRAELSLIRNQLCQIERQQSDLLNLVQRFMGNSQNGIDSLKTRVSGLEKALDMISHDLAVQTGRNPTAGSICCPSTEFLSPKFWRRTEARSLSAKPSYSGNNTNVEALTIDGLRLYEQNEGMGRDSWGSVEVNSSKSVNGMCQTSQRGRICSPRSFDAASATAFLTPGVTGA
ncbi:hypothetical protein vseg_015071 [Gypsophila vaccaria]